MSAHRSALEVAREKRDACAVEVAEAFRLFGRVQPAKFHEYTVRAAAYEQALKFEQVAEALMRRRQRVEVTA